ncbi:MAG TPA: hypothetical protein VHB02_14505 [Acidimicrobiales bacterium]|nr:hypothetical protein [Acidimicrobiales bacterium]
MTNVAIPPVKVCGRPIGNPPALKTTVAPALSVPDVGDDTVAVRVTGWPATAPAVGDTVRTVVVWAAGGGGSGRAPRSTRLKTLPVGPAMRESRIDAIEHVVVAKFGMANVASVKLTVCVVVL